MASKAWAWAAWAKRSWALTCFFFLRVFCLFLFFFVFVFAFCFFFFVSGFVFCLFFFGGGGGGFRWFRVFYHVVLGIFLFLKGLFGFRL